MKKIKNYVCFIEILVNILILVGITTGCWLINKKSTEVENESTNEENNPTIDRWHKRYGKCIKKDRHNKHNNES